MAVGILPSSTLTAPPTAPAPYTSAEGPRSTSMCVANIGSEVTAWSGLMVEASWISAPSDSTLTRGPSMPRMMGRLAPAPKWLLLMPGSPASVSPSVAERRRASSSPSSTLTGVVMSLAPSCRPLEETVTSGRVWASVPAHSSSEIANANGFNAKGWLACNGADEKWRKEIFVMVRFTKHTPATRTQPAATGRSKTAAGRQN